MDSFQTIRVSEKLIQEIKLYIEQQNRQALIKLIQAVQPSDMADLIEHLDHEERLYLFDFFETGDAGEVLMEIESPVKEKIIRDLDNESISEIVRELESDDAVDVVGRRASGASGCCGHGGGRSDGVQQPGEDTHSA